MDVKPGDVVILKSGGQPMTVAEVKGESAICLWIGEEGDLFRETLPLVVLDPIEEWALDDDENGEDENGEDDDDEDEDGEEDEDEDDEDEDDAKDEMAKEARKRR
jgi:uncharacterized protein YodC (DUF2158 family)